MVDDAARTPRRPTRRRPRRGDSGVYRAGPPRARTRRHNERYAERPVRPLRFTLAPSRSAGDSCDSGASVVVTLDLGHEIVHHAVRLEEVHAAAFAGVGPLDVQ